MSTNKYFNHTTFVSEQNLFDSLMIEAIQIHGVDVMYIKRDIPELDEILREPKFSEFKNTYTIEMYAPDGGIGSNEGFSMSKFGWLVDNNLDFVVSKTRWEIEINSIDSELNRPREGDLIYVGDDSNINNSYINTIYEIKNVKVGNDDKFQFGTNYLYTLICQVYTPSHDTFDTENDDINKWLNDNESKTSINDEIKKEQVEILIPTHNPFGEL